MCVLIFNFKDLQLLSRDTTSTLASVSAVLPPPDINNEMFVLVWPQV